MKTAPFKFSAVLKWAFMVSLLTATTLFLITPEIRNSTRPSGLPYGDVVISIRNPLQPPPKNWRNFTEDQITNLSTLGKYLFLEETFPQVSQNSQVYKILIWKVGKFLEKRHIYHFTKTRYDPFEKCSVKNCILTYDENDLVTADAVLIHLQRLKGVHELPKENSSRPDHQRWVFLTDENPFHTFLTSKVKIADFNGLFNWSMTFRLDSDVPVPYGRTVVKKLDGTQHSETNTFRKRNDVLVAVMGSNCGGKNHRWQYVRELQKHIEVDFYGVCGKLKCPGHFSKDCEAIGNYKFYLSFENSNCVQYITEKVWWNAYTKNAIPIVMGASKQDYQLVLPPNSYINVEDFARPADLARYIMYLNKTFAEYESYFEWKKYYQVLNEHGYFQSDSVHYCRLCEALNYNSKEPKVYSNLEQYWSKSDCYPSWDDPS